MTLLLHKAKLWFQALVFIYLFKKKKEKKENGNPDWKQYKPAACKNKSAVCDHTPSELHWCTFGIDIGEVPVRSQLDRIRHHHPSNSQFNLLPSASRYRMSNAEAQEYGEAFLPWGHDTCEFIIVMSKIKYSNMNNVTDKTSRRACWYCPDIKTRSRC